MVNRGADAGTESPCTQMGSIPRTRTKTPRRSQGAETDGASFFCRRHAEPEGKLGSANAAIVERQFGPASWPMAANWDYENMTHPACEPVLIRQFLALLRHIVEQSRG